MNEVDEKVKAAIGRIRPLLQGHGGDIEFVDYEDGVVSVRLRGACVGCPMAQITLTQGVERRLKEEVPEIREVRNVA